MTTIHGTNERTDAPRALGAATRARWARSPNVLDRPTRQGVMVLPPEGAAVLLTGLNARVWEALAQPLGGDQLAARLGSPAGAPAVGAGAAVGSSAAVAWGGAGSRGAGSGGGDAGGLADRVAAALVDLRAIGAVREIR